jgi:uncharacterized protein (DUF934 family)
MPRVIKDERVVEDDPWVHLADDAAPPEGGDVIVSLKRWQAERDTLSRRNGGIGVRLAGSDSPEAIKDDLARLQVVALEFSQFKDGRSYSLARLLRERYGFKGQIRAVGDVLHDQLFFMRRCGVDAFELRADRPAEDALRAFKAFSVTYQAAADDARPLYRRVHRAGPA